MELRRYLPRKKKKQVKKYVFKLIKQQLHGFIHDLLGHFLSDDLKRTIRSLILNQDLWKSQKQ